MHDIFTADDILSGAEAFSRVTPPARLGVFGDPVEHSRSPAFQNAALDACGLGCRYVLLHVKPDRFQEAVRGLGAAGFIGANVTIPHKAAALVAVDEACDTSRRCGAVNTIALRDGRLLGFSTDGPGLSRAIREEFSVDLHDLRVVLLGAGGGAGRAIAMQCASEGCERLVLVNRTAEKAQRLAAELESFFRNDRLAGPAERLVAIPFDDDSLRRELAMADLVINATSLGMRHSDPPVLHPRLITPNLMIYDTVYTTGQSRLLQDASAAGARGANGLSMLLHQGALAFSIWFDREAPLEIMRAALLECVKTSNA